MKVLLITQYFLPQPLANAEVVGGLALALVDRGHAVEVITPVRSDTSGVKIRRAFGRFAKNRSSLVGRIVEYGTFSLGALISALLAPRPDVILVPSPPPTLGLIGVMVGRVRRVPVVYNVQDLYPEVALASGALRENAALRVLGAVMRLVYRWSAAVVVIDEAFVSAIRRATPTSNVVAVRNAIDRRVFEGAVRDHDYLRAVDVSGQKPVVMYAGNVGRSQDIELVAAATADLGADFIVHGGGAGLDALRAACLSKGWHHVHFSPYRPRVELGSVFASADVHVVPLKPGIASASVPSKMLSIFSAGRPAIVLAERGSPAAAIVQEANGGWLVEPGAEAELRSTLEVALEDRAERERRGAAAAAWASVNAGLDRCAREYEAVLEAARDSARSPRR